MNLRGIVNSWHFLVWTLSILTDSDFAFLIPDMIHLHEKKNQIISQFVNKSEIYHALSQIAKFISLYIHVYLNWGFQFIIFALKHFS